MPRWVLFPDATQVCPVTENAYYLSWMGKASLAARDAKIATGYFEQRWASLTEAERADAEAKVKSMASWNFGHSDFDFCCDECALRSDH